MKHEEREKVAKVRGILNDLTTKENVKALKFFCDELRIVYKLYGKLQYASTKERKDNSCFSKKRLSEFLGIDKKELKQMNADKGFISSPARDYFSSKLIEKGYATPLFFLRTGKENSLGKYTLRMHYNPILTTIDSKQKAAADLRETTIDDLVWATEGIRKDPEAIGFKK